MLVDMVIRGASQAISPAEEVRRLCLIRGETADEAGKKVTELFSPPRINEKLNQMNNKRGIVAGTSFDLIADTVTGETWNFMKPEDRRRCWSRLEEERPWVVIGSPPCTAFSILNIGLNYIRTWTRLRSFAGRMRDEYFWDLPWRCTAGR